MADEIDADIILMDERKGRKIAKDMNLKVVGTLGTIVEAKNNKLIKEVKPLLDSLLDHDIRISKKLYNKILNYSNEL